MSIKRISGSSYRNIPDMFLFNLTLQHVTDPQPPLISISRTYTRLLTSLQTLGKFWSVRLIFTSRLEMTTTNNDFCLTAENFSLPDKCLVTLQKISRGLLPAPTLGMTWHKCPEFLSLGRPPAWNQEFFLKSRISQN